MAEGAARVLEVTLDAMMAVSKAGGGLGRGWLGMRGNRVREEEKQLDVKEGRRQEQRRDREGTVERRGAGYQAQARGGLSGTAAGPSQGTTAGSGATVQWRQAADLLRNGWLGIGRLLGRGKGRENVGDGREMGEVNEEEETQAREGMDKRRSNIVP